MPTVTIYSTATCAFCNAEKKYLTEHGIAFEEKHADTDSAAAEEMITISGQMGVPFTIITKDDGSRVEILGFDQPRLATELGISG